MKTANIASIHINATVTARVVNVPRSQNSERTEIRGERNVERPEINVKQRISIRKQECCLKQVAGKHQCTSRAGSFWFNSHPDTSSGYLTLMIPFAHLITEVPSKENNVIKSLPGNVKQ